MIFYGLGVFFFYFWIGGVGIFFKYVCSFGGMLVKSKYLDFYGSVFVFWEIGCCFSYSVVLL